MTRIGRNPALAALRFTLVASIGIGILLGGYLYRLVGSTVPYPVLAIGAVAAVFGLICGIVGRLFGSLEWDEAAGTVSIGRRTVPIATITSATRVLSTGSTANFTLSYRFASEEGPRVRILLAGRPYAGLDPDGLAALRRFIAAAPIGDPPAADDLSDEQSVLIDDISESGGASLVGKQLLLDELDDLLAARDATSRRRAIRTDGPVRDEPSEDRSDSGRPALSGRELAQLERLWREDDEDAAAYLARHPVATAPRRALFWLTLVATLVSPLALVSMLALSAARLISNDLGDNLLVVFAGAGVVAVLAFLGWCMAADLQVRSLRAVAAAWLATRTAEERTRGLAAPLLRGWTQPSPGTRIVRAVGVMGASLSGFAVLVGLVLLGEPDVLDSTTAGLTVGIGAVVFVASVLACMWTTRQRREGNRQLVRLAGSRLSRPRGAYPRR